MRLYCPDVTSSTLTVSRLPEELASRDPLAFSVRVAGMERIKDSAKNRDRVAAKLGKPGLEVVVNICPEDGNLVATFSYGGKPVTLVKKKEDVHEKKGDRNDVSDVPKIAPPLKTTTETKITSDDLTTSKSEFSSTKKEAIETSSAALEIEVGARNAELKIENTDVSKTVTSDEAKTRHVNNQILAPDDVVVESEAAPDDVVVESEALQSNMLNNQATEEGAEVRSGKCADEKINIDKMFKLVESAPMSSGKLTAQ